MIYYVGAQIVGTNKRNYILHNIDYKNIPKPILYLRYKPV